MELNYNFISLLDTIMLMQGVTLGVLLTFLSLKKHQNTFFLGLLLFILALERLRYLIPDLGIDQYYPQFALPPSNNIWLTFPLFYLYTWRISIFSHKPLRYWVLIPGVIFFIAQVVVFLLPQNTKASISTSSWYNLVFLSGHFFGWGIAIWNLIFLKRHREEVGEQYSNVEQKKMTWASIYVIAYLSFDIMGFIIHVSNMADNQYSILFFITVDLIFIYFLSYYGTLQYNINSIYAKPQKYGLTKDLVKGYGISSRTEESAQYEEIMERIDRYMMDSEIFLHTNLTIGDLANEIRVHPRRISLAINKLHQKNFNTYVNAFRVKRAILLLEKQRLTELSMEGIGKEVGFNSKSAFYSSFKQQTGKSPLKYLSTA